MSGLTRNLLGAGALALALGAPAALPQDEAPVEEDVILVLDASGSMWGQIEGEPKISIARTVIGGLLEDLPEARRLGLVAYGHNRKGDCTDIEELTPVGTDRDTIRDAVADLNPKGKTPLADSVRFAAEILKYTELPATVVLVSDGKETCEADPCALGRELEETGVNFTTHVIGFDISEDEDKAQLRCLAENTGGVYLDATDADGLSTALKQTVIEAPAPDPEPEPVTRFTLRATELEGGPLIQAGLTWSVQQAGGGEVLFETTDAGEVEAEIPPGVYDITVSHPGDDLSGRADLVELPLGISKTVTIALDFAVEASVRTVPETEAPVSSDLVVYWEGPERDGDYIAIATVDAKPGSYETYANVERSGNPAKIRMPAQPGDYEVRYLLGNPKRVLASVPITATGVEASLDAPDTVAAGSNLEVTWTGPGYEDDWITIVLPDASQRSYTDYEYTREGNPITLKAPLQAGSYEVRYVQAGTEVLVRRPIEVTGVEAALEGPETATVASNQEITWQGPGGNGDWITVVFPNAAERSYTDYAYTREGNPLSLKMPLEPGDYEFRYVQDGQKILARQPVTVTDVTASLDAPLELDAGSTLELGWEGPGIQGDWLTIVAPDARDNAYTDYGYVREGSPLSLTVPYEPGAYEIRYVLAGRRVIARLPVTVNDVAASVSGPGSVIAGETFSVAWEGPTNRNDFVTIAKPDARGSAYEDYEYTRSPSPFELKAPDEPGTYEIRYVLGRDRVIARQTVEVVAE